MTDVTGQQAHIHESSSTAAIISHPPHPLSLPNLSDLTSNQTAYNARTAASTRAAHCLEHGEQGPSTRVQPLISNIAAWACRPHTHTHTLSHSLTHSLFAPLSLTCSVLVVFKHPRLALAKYAILDFPPALCLLVCLPPQDCTVMTSPHVFPALRNGNLTPLHIYHRTWPRQRRATMPIPPLPSIFYAILSFCSTAKQ